MNSQLWLISILAGGLLGYDAFNSGIKPHDFLCFRGADAPIGSEAEEPWCLVDEAPPAEDAAR